MTDDLAVETFARMVSFIQETHRAAERATEHAGITPAQFFVLRMLRLKGTVSQVELAQTLGVTAGNVSQLVAKLETARLVGRVDLGKTKRVSLTTRGASMVARLSPEHDSFLRDRFATLSAEELRVLNELVTRLTGRRPNE